MKKINLIDIKQALWDDRFCKLFPEYELQIDKFKKDPGCTCNSALLRSILKNKDKLKIYFPNREVITQEEEQEEIQKSPNSFKVINCNIFNLGDNIKQFPKGKRLVCASRFKDKITIVLNDVESLMISAPMSGNAEELMNSLKENKMNWKVINTTIYDLEKDLNKISLGRKTIQISRYNDQVTAVINDLSSLF